MSWYNILSLVFSALAIIISIIVVIYTNKNHRIECLKVVLDIETEMNARKLEFDKTSKEIRLLNITSDVNENNIDEKIEILENYFETTKENYLNSLDRLCYCIDKKYLVDKDWRSEYRNMLNETIDTFPADFGVNSSYRNIKKINEIWQSS
ncbi:hypothetical protein [Enterobacter cloacae complex sp. CARB60]|uniref:hypothetical protein n=1 Tax=Enterobacter cloacae complex sp. CARB60 TaxID=3119569 RepID=UPI002F3F8148